MTRWSAALGPAAVIGAIAFLGLPHAGLVPALLGCIALGLLRLIPGFAATPERVASSARDVAILSALLWLGRDHLLLVGCYAAVGMLFQHIKLHRAALVAAAVLGVGGVVSWASPAWPALQPFWVLGAAPTTWLIGALALLWPKLDGRETVWVGLLLPLLAVWFVAPTPGLLLAWSFAAGSSITADRSRVAALAAVSLIPGVAAFGLFVLTPCMLIGLWTHRAWRSAGAARFVAAGIAAAGNWAMPSLGIGLPASPAVAAALGLACVAWLAWLLTPNLDRLEHA